MRLISIGGMMDRFYGGAGEGGKEKGGGRRGRTRAALEGMEFKCCAKGMGAWKALALLDVLGMNGRH